MNISFSTNDIHPSKFCLTVSLNSTDKWLLLDVKDPVPVRELDVKGTYEMKSGLPDLEVCFTVEVSLNILFSEAVHVLFLFLTNSEMLHFYLNRLCT